MIFISISCPCTKNVMLLLHIVMVPEQCTKEFFMYLESANLKWIWTRGVRQLNIHTAIKSSTVSGNLSPKYLCYRKTSLISIEALCCGYLEPKKLRVWLQNKAATPTWMKIDHFYLNGRGGFVWGPRPLSFLEVIARYQGFKMRY